MGSRADLASTAAKCERAPTTQYQPSMHPYSVSGCLLPQPKLVCRMSHLVPDVENLHRRRAVAGDLVLMGGDRPLTAWDTRTSADIEGDSGRRTSGTQGGGGQRRRKAEEDNRGEDHVWRDAGEQRVVVVVDEDAARSGTFGIEHVVLPLPGESAGRPAPLVCLP